MNENFILRNTGIIKITKEIPDHGLLNQVFKVQETSNLSESIYIDTKELKDIEILKGEYEFITEEEAKEILFNQMIEV